MGIPWAVSIASQLRHRHVRRDETWISLRPLSLFTLPNSVIEAHALADGGMVSETTPIDEIRTQNFDNNDGSIQLETYNGQTFTAHIMIVDDPKRIKVATTRYLGKRGETVLQMVEDTGAVAGVNGGLL